MNGAPKTDQINAKQRKDLMYGLLYPAVLGAGIVALVGHIAKVGRGDHFIIERICFGSVTTAIYAASFVDYPDDKLYKLTALLWDLLEIAIIFSCFWLLGLVELDSVVEIGPGTYGVFLGLIATDLLVIQPLWRKAMSEAVFG